MTSTYRCSADYSADTESMLALPGRTFDLLGPGWQQEHWGWDRTREALAHTAAGSVGFSQPPARHHRPRRIRSVLYEPTREGQMSLCPRAAAGWKTSCAPLRVSLDEAGRPRSASDRRGSLYGSSSELNRCRMEGNAGMSGGLWRSSATCLEGRSCMAQLGRFEQVRRDLRQVQSASHAGSESISHALFFSTASVRWFSRSGHLPQRLVHGCERNHECGGNGRIAHGAVRIEHSVHCAPVAGNH